MGISFGKSSSSQQATSQQRAFVDPAQESFLRNLRTQAQQLQGQQQGQVGDLFGLAQGLQGQGQQFLQGIQGVQGQLGQAQGPSQAQQALQQQAFGQNPVLGQQIGQLGEDINRQLQRQVGGAGGITAGAIGAGQGGLGGRAQVATGLASEAALNAFSRGATELRGQDIGRQLGAAQALGGLELGQQGQQLQGLLGAGQLGLGGLGALQGQFNLGLSPFQGQFQPLQNLAGIIGAPTVLSQGTAQSTGGTSGFNFGAALFGGGGSSEPQ